MLRNKKGFSLLPKQFLFRLTFINIIVIASFVILSSWAIYNTACMLADGLVTVNSQKQEQFEATLFQYLWIFSIVTIIIGSIVHFYLTKRMVQRLKKLIQSTKMMKKGHYPNVIQVKSNDEIGELMNHFNDLSQQLKVNQEQRHKLVSDLSHEFRTPLSNLNGYLKALNTGVMEGSPPLYQSLYEESKRLTKLVEQMEQLKEWDYVSSQTYVEKAPMNMQDLVEQTVHMFDWSIKEKGITVHIDVPEGEVLVFNGGISQVLSNLLDNAIGYYEGTGPITINGETKAGEYKLSVAGPGKPIPIQDHGKIFERLYRVESSRSKDLGGSGLGLAISKEIIEKHDGTIGLESSGTYHTFWFSLPLA